MRWLNGNECISGQKMYIHAFKVNKEVCFIGLDESKEHLSFYASTIYSTEYNKSKTCALNIKVIHKFLKPKPIRHDYLSVC